VFTFGASLYLQRGSAIIIFGSETSRHLMYRPTGWSKNGTFCAPYNFIKYWPIFNFFTIKISRKFAIVLSLKIPPHLNCDVTLPCEMSVLEATTENKTTSVTTHLRVRRPCSSKAETLNIW